MTSSSDDNDNNMMTEFTKPFVFGPTTTTLLHETAIKAVIFGRGRKRRRKKREKRRGAQFPL